MFPPTSPGQRMDDALFAPVEAVTSDEPVPQAVVHRAADADAVTRAQQKRERRRQRRSAS